MTEILENVSRETIDDLRRFEALVLKWTRKINLVSNADATQIWERHILDSIQVYNLAEKNGDWLDIGSGGGFPGIVAAIMAKRIGDERSFVLVDSDQRKCAFLRTVARELELNVKVRDARVEEMPAFGASVMSARAMDSLNSLLSHCERHLGEGGIALFPKGARWKQEHELAQQNWSYNFKVIPSLTNPNATILKIKELSRA